MSPWYNFNKNILVDLNWHLYLTKTYFQDNDEGDYLFVG